MNNNLIIRKTHTEDLTTIMMIYRAARAYMRAHGNHHQWINDYPSEELLLEDIRAGRSYVVTDKDTCSVVGVFCFFVGEEPTYNKIIDGAWLDDEPYGVIHRLASSGKRDGVLDAALKFAFDRCRNLRVDTHCDNSTMLTALETRGFTRCGIITLGDGSLRIAFQKRG